jgi:hypothetical protein
MKWTTMLASAERMILHYNVPMADIMVHERPCIDSSREIRDFGRVDQGNLGGVKS